jgi:hypothetical protein
MMTLAKPRLMARINKVIAADRGWPGAFVTKADQAAMT